MKKASNVMIILLVGMTMVACGKTDELVTETQIQMLEPIPTLPEERSSDGGQIYENSSDNAFDYSDDITDTTYNTDNNGDNSERSELDVWDMGWEWYGISYLDTTRTLKLITYEGYGYSRLSYYVACCCWSRATEGYWGYPNLYAAFGQNDESYWGDWLDDIWIADWAYDALDECYRDPTYCMYCNGVIEPYNYMYAEWSDSDGCMIYCWND